MSYKYLLSLIIIIPLITGGCIPKKESQMTDNKAIVDIYNKKWQFKHTDKSSHKAFIYFQKNGKVSGFSGCNTFFGQATISNNSSNNAKSNETTANLISLGPLAGTRKACPDSMQFESAILSKLARITHYKISESDNISILSFYQELTNTLTFTYQ